MDNDIKNKNNVGIPTIKSDILIGYFNEINSSLSERIRIYNKTRNKLLSISIASILINYFCIFICFFQKEPLKNVYFYLYTIIAIFLAIALSIITGNFHEEINKINKSDKKNSEEFLKKLNKINKDEIDKNKNNGLRPPIIDINTIKEHLDKVSTYEKTVRSSIVHIRKIKKSNKLKRRESGLLLRLFDSLKEKLSSLIKDIKVKTKEKEISDVKSVLDYLGGIIKKLGSNIIKKRTSKTLENNGSDVTNNINASNTSEDTGQSQSTIKTNETISTDKTNSTTLQNNGTEKSEPSIISDKTPPIIDNDKIKQEIKANIIKALENTKKSDHNLSKNEVFTNQLSDLITPIITESIKEGYSLLAKNSEENKSLINQENLEKQEVSSTEISTENVPVIEEKDPNITTTQNPATTTEPPPESSEEQTKTVQEDELDLESIFDSVRSQNDANENTANMRRKIEQIKVQTTKNNSQNQTPDSTQASENINNTNSNKNLSRKNHVKQGKSGFSIG